MIKDIRKVTVKFNGVVVGYLAEIQNGTIAFQYEDEWINTGFPISPLSLPLSNQIYYAKNNLFKGLSGVFWDSLPDGWGELLMNRLFSKKGINADNLSVLTKLTLIGENGLGGLTYEPSQNVLSDIEKVDFDVLSEEIQKILEEKNIDNLDMVYRLGGSSGGARPKAHIKYNGEDYIIKFRCRTDPENVGLQEYNANLLAGKCGINVNEFKLFDSKVCPGYFGAKRFDRNGNKRVHVISLAGLLETTHRMPNLDYGHLFNVVQNINGSNEEMYEVFRRMCFNVRFGNKDDHSKNFSFIYDEGLGKYRLSPMYDITKTIDKFEHEMTVNGNGNPTDNDILALAVDFGLSMPRCRKILNGIKEIIGSSER